MSVSKAKNMTEQERQDLVFSLVKKFQNGKKQYEDTSFNESATRLNFIDLFLVALGWDVANEGAAEVDFCNVKVEPLVRVQGQAKRADYTLCIRGQPIIIVEAKKPSVNIKQDKEPAIQARRYARSLKLPCAIVTNFKELAIYDTRQKIVYSHDSAKTARLLYLDYTQYCEAFCSLYSQISFEAVIDGKLDRWLGNTQGRKGYEPIDSEFLSMIETWRADIAGDIALHNDIQQEYDLTAPVQKLIDRIIFLRIAEGKAIEPLYTLKNCCDIQQTKKSVYTSLKSLFKKANEKYNSGLFAKDEVLEGFLIQDKTLQNVIQKDLYDECQYEFSVLPVEILGSVYEQFLGSVIQFQRKTKSGHSIKVEQKPEVQKAGGVFYTPTYIVDYIIQQTIAKTLQDKTAAQAYSLHFLDPACGSGSFLVGAYTYLLKWYLDFYTKKENLKAALQEAKIYKVQEAKATPQGTQDIYKLSLAEKKQILCNNIFGVDIDAQAVEVTKLSLFLKLLEDETAQTGDLFRASETTQKKILPDLSSNIKCGNSLIDTSYAQKGLDFFSGDESQYTKYINSINAFDWQKAFAGIMATGGFDCVIGNPPYVNLNVHPEYYEFLEKEYKEIHTGYNDLMYYFVYKGIKLLKENGLYGVIVSNYFLWNDYAKKLRDFLKDRITKLVNFNTAKIFKNANVHTLLLFAKTFAKDDIDIFSYQKDTPPDTIDLKTDYQKITKKREGLAGQWVFADEGTTAKIKKMQQNTIPLGNIMHIKRGPSSGKNDVFNISKEFAQERGLEKELLHPSIKNGDVQRYIHYDRGNVLIYTDSNTDINKCPNIKAYLQEHKKELQARNEVAKGAYKWYRLERPRDKDIIFAKEKLIVPYRAEHNRFAYDNKQFVSNAGDIYILVLKENIGYDIFFLLALLNSKPLDWYYGIAGKGKGGLREYMDKPLSSIPIPPATQEQQQELAGLAKSLLTLYALKKSEAVKRQIQALEDKVDALVCNLYGVDCL